MSDYQRDNGDNFNDRPSRSEGDLRRDFADRGRRLEKNNGSSRAEGGNRGFGDRGRRFDRNDRGGKSDRGDRSFNRGERSFNRGDRQNRSYDRGGRDNRSFDREDRGDRRFKRDDRGGRRFERDDRGGRRFERDDRGGRRFARDDRGGRRFERDERGKGRFNRDDRGGRRFDRDDRKNRQFGGRPDSQSSRSGNLDQDQYTADQFQDRLDEQFQERTPKVEGLPIPPGLEGTELDGQAYAALATLGTRRQEDVAKLLVMAGQLLDLDAERAYIYTQAAVKAAGRVDVVREAAALTAYATGRYQEALREVRAVRRMSDDYSLRAVEADCERGLGKPEKALEIIDQTDLSKVDIAEQVELVLVAAGARADMSEHEAALVLVDNAIAKLGEDGDEELLRRLMSAKADHLRALGREDEAAQTEVDMPAEAEDNDILDLRMMAESDVDDLRSDLKGSEEPLSARYDTLVLDLDGVCYTGQKPVPHAAENVAKAIEGGMKHVFITNNSSRTPNSVAEQLIELGFPTDPSHIMTSAMDCVQMMKEELPEGAKVYVIGGEGLRKAVESAGYVLVESADDQPDAVVQGFDRSVDWAMLSEGALAINAGAKFYATNLDASLPIERGFALGNGALVRAVRYATNSRAKAAGKPQPEIFRRAIAMVEGELAIAVGDRLETDVAGALSASVPTMHVLTGVHDAKAIVLADRGLRPQLVHMDMRGLHEPHPRPRHHKDGTWTCGVSQIAKATGGRLTLDGIVLPDDEVSVTLDSYRALIAAAWDWAKETETKVSCPIIHVVDNDDPAGILEQPQSLEDDSYEDVDGSLEDVDGSLEDVDGSLEDVDGSPEDVEGSLEDVDGSSEDVDGSAEDVERASGSDVDADESALGDADHGDESSEAGSDTAADDLSDVRPAAGAVLEADLDAVDVEGIPQFLPGEEDLAELMEETKHLEHVSDEADSKNEGDNW